MLNLALLSLSLRKDSFNSKLLKLTSSWLTAHKVTHEIIDLRNYPNPAYDYDLEQSEGIPNSIKQLKTKLDVATGYILSSPEYNFSIPGHFKNTFDWLSRIEPKPFVKKPLFLMSASMSVVGGNRGLWALRVPFEYFGTFVYPDMFSLASAHQAFDEQGMLKSEDMQKRLHAMLEDFHNYCHKLSAK